MLKVAGLNVKLAILTETLNGVRVFETEALGVAVGVIVAVGIDVCMVGSGVLVFRLLVGVGVFVGVPLEPLLETR